MAQVVPDPKKIKSFASERELERWLRQHHDRESEIWLRIYKLGSRVATVSYAEAIDVALCWGWIDGQRKGYDAESFLQRFSPRKARSVWSQINRGKVARLIESGRMTPHGQRHVDAAKADGRWEAAYTAHRDITPEGLPAELRAAIAASPRARRALEKLPRRELFALGFRTQAMKTPAGRARKIAELVGKLERGEAIAQTRPPSKGSRAPNEAGSRPPSKGPRAPNEAGSRPSSRARSRPSSKARSR